MCLKVNVKKEGFLPILKKTRKDIVGYVIRERGKGFTYISPFYHLFKGYILGTTYISSDRVPSSGGIYKMKNDAFVNVAKSSKGEFIITRH